MRSALKLLLIAAAAIAVQANAQSYPSKSILMIMPLQAASSIDVGMRIVTQKMSESMGQQIVVENQPGAAGLIGAERFMRATPDGYTIATLNDSILTMVPHLYKKVAYDPNRSFAPVSLVAWNTWLLVVHPTLPVRNVRELVALSKARPNELNYSSGGNGSPQHIAMEMFKSMSGAKLTHIPYKGTTQATLDLIAGQIPLMFSATSLVVSEIRRGQIRPLAAGGSRRLALFPDVPTVAESGVPGYDFNTWMALFAPLNTPRDVVAKLNGEVVKALSAPDVREKLVAVGFEIEGSSPEKLASVTRARYDQMQKIIREAGIKIE